MSDRQTINIVLMACAEQLRDQADALARAATDDPLTREALSLSFLEIALHNQVIALSGDVVGLHNGADRIIESAEELKAKYATDKDIERRRAAMAEAYGRQH